jgi:hypothetical protein
MCNMIWMEDVGSADRASNALRSVEDIAWALAHLERQAARQGLDEMAFLIGVARLAGVDILAKHKPE